MTTPAVTDVPEVLRIGPARLTAGLDADLRLDHAAHQRAHGPLPRYDLDGLIALAEKIKLKGKGGAGFPFARKLQAVVRTVERQRIAPAVVVNATEGEPGSAKDRMLLARAPHVILDGAGLVADALGAASLAIGVDEGSPGVTSMPPAVAERSWDIPVRVVCQPDRFTSGEGGSLVRGVNGLPAIPPSRKIRTSDGGNGGVDGRPTLLSNAETFAQLGIAARLGPDAYAVIGTAAEPGTVLLTVNRPDAGRPLVVEAPAGTLLGDVLDAAGVSPGQGVLVGGYHGMFLDADAAVRAPCSRAGMSAAGGSFGAGIVIPVPEDTCPLGEAARIAEWLAVQSAGQCGPCRMGLPDLARVLTDLANGGGGTRALEEARRIAGGVIGQGACSHPDGSSRFILSALTAFTDDLANHSLRGGCGRRVRGVMPLSPWGPGQDQDHLGGPTLVVDWQRCRAHGLCAALAPELFSLDAHGFPVVSNAPIPVWLESEAKRAVNQCPALALRFGRDR
ncbi:ferredoxin [Streptacidiphilus sp. ASG 303]|uniref:NADH-quinone oxidoreductase subunit NuoF family protein n=1 Tax=Streptacidiphilus sp. ASG 303 TaxID=2896847 RepID=UPI001E3BA34F|nr:NADH-quinone oxidoreductase subunit NuoF family protein [Streptacidiphilus sp. ASG 303]MCD0482711.1 ferredoxin [Streptacidiphilus sp. ASG 303]